MQSLQHLKPNEKLSDKGEELTKRGRKILKNDLQSLRVQYSCKPSKLIVLNANSQALYYEPNSQSYHQNKSYMV